MWTTRAAGPGSRFTYYDVCIYEVAHDLPCDLAWLEVRDNLPVVHSRAGIDARDTPIRLITAEISDPSVSERIVCFGFCERPHTSISYIWNLPRGRRVLEGGLLNRQHALGAPLQGTLLQMWWLRTPQRRACALR